MKSKYSTITVKIEDPVTGQEVTKSVRFVKDGYKLFFNAQHLMVLLNKGQRAWFDYLCENMDQYNRILINAELKKSFGHFIQSITNCTVSYTESSLAAYTKKLVDVGLLLNSKVSTSYIVNPKYAYRGTESDRMDRMTLLIKERLKYGLSIDKLIDVDIDTFFNRNTP